MATIDCSEYLIPIEIGTDGGDLGSVSTSVDESSFTVTSYEISGRFTFEENNIDYSAYISYYGRFKYTSVSALERSKITSI